MTDPFATSEEEIDGDISRLGKTLDLDLEFEEEMNKTREDMKSKETIEYISSWKSKYFTVLGFFLVFLAIFLIVIVFLIYKIRQSKVSKTLHHHYLYFRFPEAELFTAYKSRGSTEGGEEGEGGLLQCVGGGGGGGQAPADPRHSAGSGIPVLETVLYNQ